VLKQAGEKQSGQIVMIEKEKIQKVIKLFDIYLESREKISKQLKLSGKHPTYVVADDLTNPDRDNLIEYINSLSKAEKQYLFVLMKFGREFKVPSKGGFEYYINDTQSFKDYHIDYMISRPLSKYLRKGLIKLDLLERIN
jgi:hypothetical protein